MEFDKARSRKLKDGLRNNADAMGIGLPVIIVWALETYTGVTVPIEVAAAAAGILGSMGAKVRRAL